MQNNDYKGSLTDRFRDFGAAPSEELWQAISDELDERKKRRPMIWWWISGLGAASVALLLLVFSGMKEEQSVHLVRTARKSSEKQVSPEQSTAPKHHSSDAPSATGFVQKDRFIPIPAKHLRRTTPFTQSDHRFTSEKSTVFGLAISGNDSIQSKEAVVDPLLVLQPNLTVETGVNPGDTAYPLLAAVPDHTAPAGWSVPQSPKWKIGTHFGFANGLGEWVIFDENQPYVSYGYDPGIWTAPDNYHCFEATIGRRVKRWWLESGIQMGEFKATRPLDTSDFQVVIARTWTIGIPLSARYDIYYQPWTHTQLYLRLGTMHNFPFYRSDTYIADKNSALSSFRKEQKYFNYLGSVSATLGIEQHIWKGLSVDARPEFSFYYKPPTNSYTNPKSKVLWWFGWNFGVNWTF